VIDRRGWSKRTSRSNLYENPLPRVKGGQFDRSGALNFCWASGEAGSLRRILQTYRVHTLSMKWALWLSTGEES